MNSHIEIIKHDPNMPLLGYMYTRQTLEESENIYHQGRDIASCKLSLIKQPKKH